MGPPNHTGADSDIGGYWGSFPVSHRYVEVTDTLAIQFKNLNSLFLSAIRMVVWGYLPGAPALENCRGYCNVVELGAEGDRLISVDPPQPRHFK